MKKIIFSIIAATLLTATGCKTPVETDGTAAYADFSVECLGVDGDGSQTLRVFGKGNNRADAIEQAKRNAVNEVLFKGITLGTGDCNKRPIVTEVNARERYEDYFDRFFTSGGAYTKYVRLDEKRTSRIRARSKDMEQWGVVVTVDRAALRSRLKSDGVIK